MFSRTLRNHFVPKTVWRGFATTAVRDADFTHAVIGGGAVGLAIARKLAAREGTSTILIERNGEWVKKPVREIQKYGRAPSVIHAGLYYGPSSLKTTLCIRGRQLLYSLCQKYSIPHRNTGKWIVAQTDQQWEELEKVHKFSKEIEGAPTHFISLDEATKLEPYVQAKARVLVSPTTGIVDSHSYMQFLLGDFEDRGGDVALYSPVTRIEGLGARGNAGWAITTTDKKTGEESTITSETIINSAGLGACDINNMILPPSRHRKQFYAKGNYFSYSASSPKTRRLIYPAPEPGSAGLGTHLTLDIAGRLRFGPDVEWVDSASDLSVNTERLAEAIEQIKKYLPGVQEENIMPDYAGIRPKLGKGSAGVSGKGFLDFVIRKEEGYEGFVNLLGIESPGLTSSLAIAEMVDGLLYRRAGEVVCE